MSDSPTPGRWPRVQPHAQLALILLAGGAARAWLIADVEAVFRDDMRDFFIPWSRALATLGLHEFYHSGRFCDYPPLSVLMLQGLGRLAAWFAGGTPHDATIQHLVKFTACVADAVIAVVLFVEARRLIGVRAAPVAAGLYFLNPATFYNSAYWGQLDSVFAALVLLGLAAAGRRRWTLAGAATALALLAKFQAISLAPIVVFEAHRAGGWPATGRKLLAAIVAAAVVLAPFVWTGTLEAVVERSYVNVVGQYHSLSKNAYNIWYLVGQPGTSDTTVPTPILHAAANGRADLGGDDSWLLWLTWRHISLVVYATAVAVILAAYSRRPTAVGLHRTCGLLGLAFFLLPTEMHERYALPALAFLSLWAASAPAAERTFTLLSALMLLNLAAVFSPEQMAELIAAGFVALFVMLLVAPSRPWASPLASIDAGLAATVPPAVDVSTPKRPLILAFELLTVAAVVAVVAIGVWIAHRAATAPPPGCGERAVFASALPMRDARQDYKAPQVDRSVDGGPLQLRGRYFLRGLGTHAPSALTYDAPPGAARFRARVGIHDASGARGSAIAFVELDGERVYTSPRLTGGGPTADVDVTLDGARTITLGSDTAGDGPRADHVDWALARFE